MSDKVKALIAGCGSISNRWLECAANNDKIHIVGLVDINEEAAKGKKAQFNLDDAVTSSDFEKTLNQLKPDVVFDCTIPEAHVNVTLAALENGCHVLGEKPLADTMENAKKMVEAAQKSGKIYTVIQNRRYQPTIRAYSEFISSGTIGELTTLNADFYIGAHFGGFRDRMKHVLLLDMAIHTFDQARLISGADPVAVYCKEWNPKGSWYDHDASAVAIFEMTNGIIFTYRGSWCSEGLNTTWESSWHAICQKGSVSWDGADAFRAQKVVETGPFFSKWEDVEVPIPENAKDGGHQGVIDEFIDCVLNGGTPETICTDNIKSLAMVFGAVESAETGKRVEIGEKGEVRS